MRICQSWILKSSQTFSSEALIPHPHKQPVHTTAWKKQHTGVIFPVRISSIIALLILMKQVRNNYVRYKLLPLVLGPLPWLPSTHRVLGNQAIFKYYFLRMLMRKLMSFSSFFLFFFFLIGRWLLLSIISKLGTPTLCCMTIYVIYDDWLLAKAKADG